MRLLHLLAGCLVLGASAASAEPGYYLVQVYDNAGEKAVDVRYWTVKPNGSQAFIWPELGVSYGVNTRWTTEVYASWIGTWDDGTRFDTINFQNDVLLTQGERPYDLAVHTNLLLARDASTPDMLELGPVFQTESGRTQLNANVFFERPFNGRTSADTMLQHQWQVKYRWRPALHIGLQGFGEVGTWDDWTSRAHQSHRVGPAIAGSWYVAEGQALRYEAALLKGRIYGRDGTMFSMRLRWAFR